MSLTIAVIDNTVSSFQFHLKNIQVYKLTEHGDFIHTAISNEPNETYHHADICSAIIQKYCDAPIINLSVLDDKMHCGSIDHLVKAVQWCIEHQISIICLSAGSIQPEDYEALDKVCREAEKNHILIVAAQNNNRKYTMPAGFSNVIGVRQNKEYRENQYAVIHEIFTEIDIEACSHHLLRDKTGSILFTPICNSYAAPYIAAKVYNLMKENHPIMWNKKEMIQLLKKDAVQITEQMPDAELHIFYKEYQLMLQTDKEIFSYAQYNQMVKAFHYHPLFDKSLEEIPVIRVSFSLLNKEINFLPVLIQKLTECNYYFSVISDNKKDLKEIKTPCCLYYPEHYDKKVFCALIGYIYTPNILLSLSDIEDTFYDLTVQLDNKDIIIRNNETVMKTYSASNVELCAETFIDMLESGIE